MIDGFKRKYRSFSTKNGGIILVPSKMRKHVEASV